MHIRLLAASLALVLSSAATPQESPGASRFAAYPLIHQVKCAKVLGTAFRIGRTTFETAAHVASNVGCTIDGAPVSIASIDGQLDAATISAPIPSPDAAQIDCGGFKVGQWYWADGYANGLPLQLLMPVYAAAYHHASGLQILVGPELFIPGMSGGPVMDSSGRVVGIVNAYNREYRVSLSRALKDTNVCS